MKNLTSLWVVLITCFMLSACKKDKDDPEPEPEQEQLPPITQEGAYTFGCLIDGEIYVPKHYSNSIVNPPVVLQASWYQQNQENGKRFVINAEHRRKDDNSPREGIVLYTSTDSIENKIYLDVSFLADSLASSGSIYTYEAHKNGPNAVYRSIGGKNSWIHFSRFDTINRIASGTFSIDLLNRDDDQDTVRVREGRFDVFF